MAEAVSAPEAGSPRRDRLVVLGAMGALLLVSWAFLLGEHAPAGAAGPAVSVPHMHGTPGAALAGAFLMWLVMMVAMMLPPVLPWVLLFAAMSRRHDSGRPLISTWVFVSGYLGVWALYSLAGAMGQVALQQAGWLHGESLRVGRAAGAAVLIVAGLFQLSPWKDACLRHCRSPLSFFLARWRDGAAGACGMGFRHGLFCVGCCWALMAVAFAAGVMNLLWMVALTLLLCVEKIAPGGAMMGRAAGLGLVLWGARLLWP